VASQSLASLTISPSTAVRAVGLLDGPANTTFVVLAGDDGSLSVAFTAPFACQFPFEIMPALAQTVPGVSFLGLTNKHDGMLTFLGVGTNNSKAVLVKVGLVQGCFAWIVWVL